MGFQARMKQITDNPQFKQSMDKTKEMMKDEAKVKELEESMKEKIEIGTKELEEYKKKTALLEEEEKTETPESEEGVQTAAGIVPKKKNRKKSSSKKKKGKGKGK